MDRKAMYKISYGMFVLTTRLGSKDNGCIINTAIQAASNPNQMSICVDKANYTNEMIRESGEFNVSVLSENASFDLFKRFGFQSGKDVDKFLGFNGYAKAANGINYITEGTNAYFSVKVEKTIDIGSHTMFIGEIQDAKVLSELPSATYEYYRKNIKPAPEPAKAGGTTKWVCTICGYVYEGEELPEDFICPICKHPASDFEKITA
ncbi:MAG: flavin reductase [Eubacteriales bacterium]|nr:flavin reductase [Eubacteriales bacterium]